MKKKILIISLIVIDVFVAICFFLFYGPVKNFREFLVTTAMTTMNHKYLARTFYSEKAINNILSANFVSAFNDGSDPSQVEIGVNEDIKYATSYERQILERNKDDVYKLIEFEYSGYKVYLTAIYDPSRVSLVQTAYLGMRGETLVEMSKRHNALVAINGGGFEDWGGEGTGGSPQGVVIKDSKIAWHAGNSVREIAGFTNDNVLLLTYSTPDDALKKGMRDAVQFGPFLIVNGVSAKISGNGGWGINPRTVLAQRKDGIVLFLIVDGNGVNKYDWNGRGGASMTDLLVILERYGAYNAVNMDGGASTTMVVKGSLYNSPCGYSDTGERWLPNGWMVK